MLAVIPVILLLVTVIFTWLFALVKLRPGTVWLFTAIAITLAWGTMILVGILLPEPIVIEQYLPQPNIFTDLVFHYDEQSWSIGFLLISLLSAVIFSEAKHLHTPDYIRKISGSILLTAIALIAVMADSLLAFVLAWALIDIVEFGVLAVVMGGQARRFVPATTSILFRVVGIFMLLFFITVAPVQTSQAEAIVVTSPYWGMIVLLVLFRMGTLPLFQPYVNSPDYQRGIVTILRMLPLATVFAFIQHIGAAGNVPTVGGLVYFVLVVAILWGAISWFSAENELRGRPYFLFTMACFGLVVLLSGNYLAVTGLAVLLIAGGGGIFLYAPRGNKIDLFVILLVISLMTIPFTPTAAFSQLFIGMQSILAWAGMVIGLAFLITGMIKHSLQRVESNVIPERWMGLFHSLALYFSALAPWVIVVVYLNQQSQYLEWWPWISIAVLCVVIMAIFLLLRSRVSVLRGFSKGIGSSMSLASNLLGGILRFTWVSDFMTWFGRFITRLVNGLAQVMEGDGGILWSFLLIALLLSLLLTRQVP